MLINNRTRDNLEDHFFEQAHQAAIYPSETCCLYLGSNGFFGSSVLGSDGRWICDSPREADCPRFYFAALRGSNFDFLVNGRWCELSQVVLHFHDRFGWDVEWPDAVESQSDSLIEVATAAVRAIGKSDREIAEWIAEERKAANMDYLSYESRGPHLDLDAAVDILMARLPDSVDQTSVWTPSGDSEPCCAWEVPVPSLDLPDNPPDYHSFNRIYIGSSDIATLLAVGPSGKDLLVHQLHFDGDGAYYAYDVPSNVDIGDHYKLVASFHHWLKIYDDRAVVFDRDAPRFNIYRAGSFGCIIQTLEE